MKKLLFLPALLLGLFMFSSGDAKAQAAASATSGGYCGCASCNCWHYYGNCMWAVTDAVYNGSLSEMPVKISILNQTTIVISYQQQIAVTHEKDLEITSAVPMPKGVCAQLGVASININPGNYMVDYSQNPFGNIVCSAEINFGLNND